MASEIVENKKKRESSKKINISNRMNYIISEIKCRSSWVIEQLEFRPRDVLFLQLHNYSVCKMALT